MAARQFPPSIFLPLFFSLIFFTVFVTPVLAQETKQGVLIEPAVQKIFLDQDGLREPVQNISLANTTDIPQTFTVEAIEFTNTDKYGGNIFLGQSIAKGDFETATWMAPSETEVSLAPGEKKEIVFTLQNEYSLAPGAHYGAIVLRAVKPEGTEPEDVSKVYLHQIAASLVYLSKEAGSEKKVLVQPVRYVRSWFSLPSTASLTILNQGSDFIEPRGFATIHNFFGTEITRGVLNETSKTLFPGQEREIETHFEKVHYFFPGKYIVTIQYRFDDGEYQSENISFWYWEPLALLTSAVFLLAIIIFLILINKKRHKNTKKD